MTRAFAIRKMLHRTEPTDKLYLPSVSEGQSFLNESTVPVSLTVLTFVVIGKRWGMALK